jgi:hypothetical protein
VCDNVNNQLHSKKKWLAIDNIQLQFYRLKLSLGFSPTTGHTWSQVTQKTEVECQVHKFDTLWSFMFQTGMPHTKLLTGLAEIQTIDPLFKADTELETELEYTSTSV